MDQIKSLLSLPVETLVVLAAGYLGYKIAFTSLTKSHKPIDIVFISLAFGLVAQIVFSLSEDCLALWKLKNTEYTSAIVAVFSSVVAAAIWRKWGAGSLATVLRAGNVSFSDGTQTAWDAIRVSTVLRPTQLTVRKTNGKQLMCDNLHIYADKPFGPCSYGEDGSISMYVTAVRASSEDDWQDIDPVIEEYGVALTYIPANQISEIEVCHKV